MENVRSSLSGSTLQTQESYVVPAGEIEVKGKRGMLFELGLIRRVVRRVVQRIVRSIIGKEICPKAVTRSDTEPLGES